MTELQILVNHFNEDDATVTNFLQSLARQTGVSFEVLIASDGGDGLSREQLTGCPFPIRYVRLPHAGVCHTRNVLMDRATSPYLMFCDIDDEFSKDGLASLLSSAREHDVTGSPYHAERPSGNGMQLGLIKHDTLRVHGKIFKRSYLLDKGIRFPDEMETGGDMAFLYLAYSLTSDIVWTEDAFYTWRHNPSSVTRCKPYFSYQEYGGMLRCYSILADDLMRRGEERLRAKLIATVFAKMYADYTNETWWGVPDEYRNEAERHMAEYARRNLDAYMYVGEGLRRVCHDTMRRLFGGGTFGGLMNWARHMCTL